jgi:predicted metal-dependent hydrolase
MANSNNIFIEGIGNVRYLRSPKARRIRITVQPHDGISVTIPNGMSILSAKKFILLKKNWISSKLKVLNDLKKFAYENTATISDYKKAQNILINRLKFLAEKNGFQYNRVTIRNQKTRWGSCSSKNNINLNINLLKLPPKLIDYALFHELVHTYIKNHSRRFWQDLDKYVGNAKKLDKELKKYRLEYLMTANH